jgi:hypothetical protein
MARRSLHVGALLYISLPSHLSFLPLPNESLRYLVKLTMPPPVTEPFPFLRDIDLHPNGNTCTTIIRNPSVPRPTNLIFSSPPRVPYPSTPVRYPRNCYQGVAPEGGMPVPGLVMGGPPPVTVYSPPSVRSFGQGQVLAWQRGVVGGGQSAWIGELHQDLDMERTVGQVQLPAVNHEIQSPKVTGIHRHYRKRQSLRQE